MTENILLKDCLKVLNGHAFKSKFFNGEKKGLPLIRIRNLQKGSTETYYHGKYEKKYLVNKGDLLIGMDGEFKIYKWGGKKGLLNQRVCKLTDFKDHVLLEYVYYLVGDELKKIEERTPFVTVKHISSKQIENIQIPNVSLEKQEEIVNIFKKIDSLRVLRVKSHILTKKYLDSLLYETIKKGSKLISLGDLSEIITKGTTPTTFGFDYVEQGIPFIRAENIIESPLRLKNINKFISNKANQSFKRSITKQGDVLFTIAGTIGRSTYLTKELNNCNVNQAVCIIRLKKRYSPEYVASYLNSAFTYRQIIPLVKQVAQANLNLKQVAGLQIPIADEESHYLKALKKIKSLQSYNHELMQKIRELHKNVIVNYKLNAIDKL